MNTPPPEVSATLRRSRWLRPLLVLLLVAFGAATWLGAVVLQDGRIEQVSATPSSVLVSTSTPVTFTAVIADSSLRKHDPLKVVLIRTDASGKLLDIVGRLADSGRKADAKRNDSTYTLRVTLNEETAGPVYFKVAAKFREPLSKLRKDDDDDDDWDRDLRDLRGLTDRRRFQDRLSVLFKRFTRYEVSDPIVVTVTSNGPTLTIDQPTATPNYIVVSISTPVLFIAKVAGSTASSSVTLLQTDANGNTLSTIGALNDAGANGDATAGDKVFSRRVTLTPSAVGALYYRVSAVFGGSTQPVLSSVVAIPVWQAFTSQNTNVSIAYPSTWFAHTSESGTAFSNVQTLSPLSDDSIQSEAIFGFLRLSGVNPSQEAIEAWFADYFSGGFANDLLSVTTIEVAGRRAVRIETIEIGRRVHIYVPNGTDVIELTYGLNAPQFVNDYESIVRSVRF